MKIKSITSVLLATVATVAMALPVLASPAVLVGKETGSRVNVRTYPSTEAESLHYGLVGDRVEVIEQKEGRDGYIWFCVEFPSGATGWVRSDFIRYLRN